jgi:hypothetical protein
MGGGTVNPYTRLAYKIGGGTVNPYTRLAYKIKKEEW